MRAQQGVAALSWDDSLASTACERAEEIVSDFSHNGRRNCDGENLYKSTSSSVSAAVSDSAKSGVHNINMTTDAYTRAGAAICHSGNMYYFVVCFGF